MSLNLYFWLSLIPDTGEKQMYCSKFWIFMVCKAQISKSIIYVVVKSTSSGAWLPVYKFYQFHSCPSLLLALGSLLERLGKGGSPREHRHWWQTHWGAFNRVNTPSSWHWIISTVTYFQGRFWIWQVFWMRYAYFSSVILSRSQQEQCDPSRVRFRKLRGYFDCHNEWGCYK